MADTVRYLMEEMIPELEDMERRGYFNKEEIKQIVKKRTDFEYALKRRSPIKARSLLFLSNGIPKPLIIVIIISALPSHYITRLFS